MNMEKRLAMSFYETIGVLNEEHNITIVQHRNSHKIYIKKELLVYNKAVYENLYEHPITYMPKIYEMYEEDGVLTIIEEYISGDTLEEILSVQDSISSEKTVEYFLKICDIVRSLHKKEPAIIHRDIKPSNIMITPSQDVYLLDMNAGKYVSKGKDKDTHLLGTIGYAAPEQYGFGHSDEYTDIYSMGILLQQILHNKKENSMFAHPLDIVVEKCTQMAPASRYHTIDELVIHIKQLMNLPITGEEKGTYRSSKAYILPGFRRDILFHKVIASIGYIFLALICATSTLKTTYKWMQYLERSAFFLSGLWAIGFTCNYLGIQRKFPFCNHENRIVKMLAILVYDVLGMFTILLAALMLE